MRGMAVSHLRAVSNGGTIRVGSSSEQEDGPVYRGGADSTGSPDLSASLGIGQLVDPAIPGM